MFLAAAVQLTSTSDEAASLDRAEALVRRAADLGAALVVTPENTNFLGPHTDKVARAQTLDGPVVARFAGLAEALGITLVLGSFNERSDVPGKCHNTSVVFGPDGRILATYRKLHLFDVDVSDEVRFRESDTVVPGQDVVVADTPVGPLGLSICYDLRFPELYRALTDRGARVLLVPSAFTQHTGKDHWDVLVRARAIENQAFVIAPGQFGEHDDAGLRRSWGHSMIVDPWGHVVAMASDGPGIALASLDPSHVDRVRRAIPVSSHRRL
ncbi:MAG: carbon-nitrogen hydrolase family protein [Alphaproteobacteria bacterium]|nr:carbon-nitrogen hydrolase family protein [Alphaproteobacteria bacterium]